MVLMYVRYPLSLRNVEDLLFERDIDICHMKGFCHWRWHLDEMYVKISGEMVYLWRAVDHEGEILESYHLRRTGTDGSSRTAPQLGSLGAPSLGCLLEAVLPCATQQDRYQ